MLHLLTTLLVSSVLHPRQRLTEHSYLSKKVNRNLRGYKAALPFSKSVWRFLKCLEKIQVTDSANHVKESRN